MFGGYGIYEGGAMFALIADSTLYLKVDAATRGAYEAAGAEQFLAKMPYYAVSEAWLEDVPTLHAHARAAIAVGHATARPKAPRRRAGPSSRVF
jgi:DNA transformation protein